MSDLIENHRRGSRMTQPERNEAMDDEKRAEPRPMTVAFNNGDVIDQDGAIYSSPTILVDQNGVGELVLDVCADRADGNSVNIVLPLDELFDAIAFLTHQEPASHE